jgi:Lon protease-like protein
VVDTLPLFPLQTVLFPGVVLPLRVFEDRYRLLVQRLLAIPEDEPRRFGVVAIKVGSEVGPDQIADPDRTLHRIGCVAELRQVTDRDDGGYEIVSVGVEPFRIRAVDPNAEPYLMAEVEPLPAESDESPELTVLASRAKQVFTDYLAALSSIGGVRLSQFEMPDDPDVLSYLIGSAALLPVEDRQSLLEIRHTADRLRRELRLLRRESVLITELHVVPAPAGAFTGGLI